MNSFKNLLGVLNLKFHESVNVKKFQALYIIKAILSKGLHFFFTYGKLLENVHNPIFLTRLFLDHMLLRFHLLNLNQLIIMMKAIPLLLLATFSKASIDY